MIPTSQAELQQAPPAAVAPRARFYVLDCVRLFAMLMMMQGHTIDALLSREFVAMDQFPWTTWQFIRGLTAPVFLLISGAVHVFATRRDLNGRVPRDLLQRRLRWALTLIGIGYMMTFPADDFIDVFWMPASGFFRFWQINILQLSGAALLMLMAAFMLTRDNRRLNALSLSLGFGIIAATPFVHAVDWFAHIPAFMANYLTHVNGSLFPVFPYAAYLFLGVSIGRFLQWLPAEGREERFGLSMLGAGLLIVAVALSMEHSAAALLPAHDHWHSGPTFMLERLGWSLVFIGAATGIYLLTRRLDKHYVTLGSKALHIYIAHLILLYGTPWYAGYAKTHYQQMTLWESLTAAVLVIGLCIGGVYIYEYWKRERRVLWSVVRYTATGALIYALIF